MTEKFRFKQIFVEHRAVQREKRSVVSCPAAVDGTGNEFFTRAGLTGNQNGRFRYPGIGNKAEKSGYGLASADYYKFAVIMLHDSSHISYFCQLDAAHM
jgi:hypothetical protein